MSTSVPLSVSAGCNAESIRCYPALALTNNGSAATPSLMIRPNTLHLDWGEPDTLTIGRGCERSIICACFATKDFFLFEILENLFESGVKPRTESSWGSFQGLVEHNCIGTSTLWMTPVLYV